MLLTKEFVFHAAHHLAGRVKEPLHGHSYRLQVTVEGKLNKDGVVILFQDLEKIAKEKILRRLNHNYLNKLVKQPTAEHIAIWIWNQLKKNLLLYEIRLWETPTSFVVYRGIKGD